MFTIVAGENYHTSGECVAFSFLNGRSLGTVANGELFPFWITKKVEQVPFKLAKASLVSGVVCDLILPY